MTHIQVIPPESWPHTDLRHLLKPITDLSRQLG